MLALREIPWNFDSNHLKLNFPLYRISLRIGAIIHVRFYFGLGSMCLVELPKLFEKYFSSFV